ncbi:uncharacterized protein LOC126195525 [Schistocerca nitens]|uniref:uncharacterized protein LOC126195525 n=1 Tax=Schistocerca nitens TaxID=7011 RepID=UPI00211950C5|nr:uncharacterized protein LOC126195525 [Schistocerca nitens]
MGCTPPPLVLLLLLLVPAALAQVEEEETVLGMTEAAPEDPPAPLSDDNDLDMSDLAAENGYGAPEECDPELAGFELVTGYVFSAPSDLLDSLPGTLMLTDCLDACQANESCRAVNYETGLCVLFSSDADMYPGALTRSQFPVFTIYAQKLCLEERPCERAWCADRVLGHRLVGHARRTETASSRHHCLGLCLSETEFVCRSANYESSTGRCELSDMDRVTGGESLSAAPGQDYLENQCAEEPARLCEFRRVAGRVLKTVDAVYQDVHSADECRELCLTSPFRCRSYDYGETGELVCRLSHHSRTTLTDIQEPYLVVPEAATYELRACYNVTVECGAGDMVARVRTSALFSGRLYARNGPRACATTVRSSLFFELRMRYDDVECGVRRLAAGRYVADVVVQHHAAVLTSADLGLALACQYDLTNKSVSSEADLSVRGDARPALSEDAVVESPSVAMRVTDRRVSDRPLPAAQVGDPLALRFSILDPSSPFDIFVRDLVAMDGVGNSEILLIDSDGCPTDHAIMGPIFRSMDTQKELVSHFDAFKFPSSDVVQFRALVTPCVPSCEPAHCELGGSIAVEASDEDPAAYSVGRIESLGRRRRRRSTAASSAAAGRHNASAPEDLLLVQSIRIADKFFGFERQGGNASGDSWGDGAAEAAGGCASTAAVLAAGAAALCAQLCVLGACAAAWRRARRHDKLRAGASADSVAHLYDSGYARRF